MEVIIPTWAFDMHGNVEEWVHDWRVSATFAPDPVIDPTGAANSTERVRRGGGYNASALGIRSSWRTQINPSFNRPTIGFRVALKFRNDPPESLAPVEQLSVSVFQPVGTVVGQFNATDPDGNAITYYLVSGEGQGSISSTPKKQISQNHPLGSKVWNVNTGGWAISSPVMSDDGIVFMASKSRKVYAINPADGSIVWETDTTGILVSILLF